MSDLAATLHLSSSPALGGNDATQQYTLTLSLSGTTTATISTQLKDINGNNVSPSGSGYADFQFISYGSLRPDANFTPDARTVASASNNNDGTGVVTAQGVGQVVIEVRYAKVDEPASNVVAIGSGAQQGNNFIKATIIVTVTT